MRILIFSVVFMLKTICYGQVDSVYKHDVLITFSPSAFLNVFPGIQFGIEKFIGAEETIEFEVARLLTVDFESSERQNENTRFETKNGVRFKFGYKKFLSTRGIFLATLYYRKTNHDFEEWVFIDQGRFEQLINYSSTKRLLGPTIGFGLTNKLKNSFYIETAVNLGIGSYEVQQTGVPDGVILNDRIFEGYHRSGDYYYPIIGLSLKIKYGL